MEIVHSEFVSPCSPIVLQRWGHEVKQDPAGEHEDHFLRHAMHRLPETMQETRNPENLDPRQNASVENPYRRTCRFPKLFSEFPRTLIVCGDAERLVREVRSLDSAMKSDGVDVTTVWAPDACHDVLIMGEFWWDRKVVRNVWKDIGAWAKDFYSSDGQ